LLTAGQQYEFQQTELLTVAAVLEHAECCTTRRYLPLLTCLTLCCCHELYGAVAGEESVRKLVERGRGGLYMPNAATKFCHEDVRRGLRTAAAAAAAAAAASESAGSAEEDDVVVTWILKCLGSSAGASSCNVTNTRRMHARRSMAATTWETAPPRSLPAMALAKWRACGRQGLASGKAV
jgi:hypothetical protein